MAIQNPVSAERLVAQLVTPENPEGVAPAGATDLFNAAMERARTPDPAGVVAVDQPAPVSESAEASDRVLKGLDLPGAAAPKSEEGDMILDGLSRLRGVFDKEIGEVNRIMESPMVDMKTMLAVQVEVVNFSLLVDVTSKLTGKTTQSFDTLMKGQ